jgi:hypothetical protein
MTRVLDWELRLIETVEGYRAKTFDWQASNCLHMAADVVRAVRGDDAELPIIPDCVDAKDAARQLKSRKAKSVADIIGKLFDEIPRTQAMRGDIGVMGLATVVCAGLHWFGRSEAGPIYVSVDKVERAFRV